MKPASAKRAAVLSLRFSLALLFLMSALDLAGAAERRVLVYTKNGKGYVHDNITNSVAAIKKLGAENSFIVDVSDDPAAFTTNNLSRYQAIIFDNSNNEIFDTEAQKAALQNYIRHGGGFVGIHSASGGEREWPWFWQVLGGKFKRHPKLQTFTVKVKDPNDPSTKHFSSTFEWKDEFYFLDHMADGLHVLLAGDLATLVDPLKDDYPGKKFGDEFPLAWKHEVEGGRAWYTALGHQKEHYSDPVFMQHILGGILWAIGSTP
jgi:type 1 glutamine amidotransferase